MKRNLLLLIVALQTAWVLGTVAVQERALTHGDLILLETRPVDPRDLLRGDYVILNYQISDVNLTAFSPALTNSPPPGTTIYVALSKRGEFHEVARASLTPLAAQPGETIIHGRAAATWRGPSTTSVHVEYGLERYYVAEGTGNPTGKLTVQASVPKSGAPVIKQVFVNGKPYADVMRGVAR